MVKVPEGILANTTFTASKRENAVIDVLYHQFPNENSDSQEQNQNFIIEYGLYEVGEYASTDLNVYDSPIELNIHSLQGNPVEISIEVINMNDPS